MSNIYKGTLGLIGNTPLVEVVNIEKELGLEATVLVKLEYFNPAGSVKDRIAKAMIEDAEEKGLLKEGQYDEAQDIVLRVGEVLKNELAPLGLTLIDFKIEVGYDENGKMYVADEITPDIWRVRDENGNIPNQIDCANLLLKKMNI